MWEEGLVTCCTQLFCWNAIIGRFTWRHVRFILRGARLPIISKGARCLMTMRDIVEARDYGNAVKLQSDWCRSVQDAGTTPCIASHQTLSPCIRVWLRETSHCHGYNSRWISSKGYPIACSTTQICIRLRPLSSSHTALPRFRRWWRPLPITVRSTMWCLSMCIESLPCKITHK